MRKAGWVVGVVLVLAAIATGLYQHIFGHSDELRQIVMTQCMPNERENHHPAPCVEENLQHGYAVLKDQTGPLQFLLMPAQKINGIESPLLLDPATPNFFWYAWQARRFMSAFHGSPVPDSAVSLTINSRFIRTQNHLHIHISCLRHDVRRQIDQFSASDERQWEILPGGIDGYLWMVRRVSPDEFHHHSPFMMLAEGIPHARMHMGRYSLAVLRQSDGDFLLMATERNLLRINFGLAEQIQDHNCTILKKL